MKKALLVVFCLSVPMAGAATAEPLVAGTGGEPGQTVGSTLAGAEGKANSAVGLHGPKPGAGRAGAATTVQAGSLRETGNTGICGIGGSESSDCLPVPEISKTPGLSQK